MAIQKHGSIERLCKSEADKFGWKAKVERNGSMPWDDDGTGIVVLERNGGAVSFEYGLPEEEADMIWQVRAIIEADSVDVERRQKGGGESPLTRLRRK
jgi:hypothetical protein